MRILTWNVNCFTPNRAALKRVLLELMDWDVALLQEVGASTFAAFTDDAGFDGVHALVLAGGERSFRDHGVAILVHNARVEILDAALIDVDDTADGHADRPSTRAMWARVCVLGHEISVASAHAYDAAGRDPEVRAVKVARKMRFYRSLDSWCSSRKHPTVVGGDFNTWLDTVDSVPLDPADPFHDEHRFVAPGASHGLLDVQLEHLRTNDPASLQRRRHLGAIGMDGALAVTYQRSSRQYPKVCRMDRIYASPDFIVRDVETDYGDALTVGSDHALVTAQLELRRGT